MVLRRCRAYHHKRMILTICYVSQGTTLAISPAISAYDPDTFNATLRYSIMAGSLSRTFIEENPEITTIHQESTLREYQPCVNPLCYGGIFSHFQ